MNKYYVYMYVDPRMPGRFVYDGLDVCFLYEPIYVGKGSKDRWRKHLFNCTIRNDRNKLKINKFLKIINAGYNLTDFVFKVCENLSENSAYNVEEQIIKAIGIKTDGGTLTNISKNGRGGPTLYGNKNPNKNIPGQTNIVNLKKSIKLKQTWADGKFSRTLSPKTQAQKDNISTHKKRFWSNNANKLAHSNKWKELWSDPVYLSMRSNKIKNNWVVQYNGGEPFTINNLAMFCKEHRINYESMRVCLRSNKPYKGYAPVLSTSAPTSAVNSSSSK